MTTLMDPLTPTEAELVGMTKPQLTAVIESYGVRPSSKTDKPGLLKTARAFVHERLSDLAALQAAAEPAPHEPEPAADAPGTDIEKVALEPVPLHVVPEYSRFQVIQQVAAVLAKSNLTPDALRGKVPDVTHILLKANDVGIPLTTALEQVYVIHGKTGMESKLMRALIRRDGHTLSQPTYDGFKATVSGRRCDTGEEGEAEFTLDDAKDFDLIAGWHLDNGGNYIVDPIRVNGSEPKPQWRKDTKNMLIERATARLARWLFSECLGGITYTPDELGYIEVDEVDADGTPRPFGRAGEDEPTMTHKQAISELARRLHELPDDLRKEVVDEWKRARFPKGEDLRPPQIPQVSRWLDAAEAKAAERAEAETADIDEAEVVETAEDGEPVAGEPGSSDGQPGDDDQGGVAASPAPAAQPDAGEYDPTSDVLMCGAGDGEIAAEAPVIWGDDDRPYHVECSPFG